MTQNWHFIESVQLFFLTMAGVFSTILIYLGLSEEMFTIFTILIFIDFFTGIWAAANTGEKVTSKRASSGVLSKFSLLIVPIIIALPAKALGEDASVLFNWGLGLLIASEAYSAISNIVIIRTGKPLPEWDALSLLARAIRQKFEKRLND